jgi:hypothetical protein
MSGYTEKPDWLTIKDKGIAILVKLIDKTSADVSNWPQFKDIYIPLYGLYIQYNEIDKAEALVNKGLELDPYNISFLSHSLFTIIAKGNIARALTLAEILSKEDKYYLFELSLTQILNNHDNSEYTCNQFFKTEHQYKDFIRLWLYYDLVKNGQHNRAKTMLKTRWQKIDTTVWESRMENGDDTVLREMLIGYYLGAVDEKLIFEPLKNKQSFDNHLFSKTGPYQGIRCEALLYKALFCATQGDQQGYKEFLQKTLSTKYSIYYEYQIAKYLLSEISNE